MLLYSLLSIISPSLEAHVWPLYSLLINFVLTR